MPMPLRFDLAEASGPVGQRGAGAAAAADLRPGEPLGERAALVDVLDAIQIVSPLPTAAP
jgi:hypothetical protein